MRLSARALGFATAVTLLTAGCASDQPSDATNETEAVSDEAGSDEAVSDETESDEAGAAADEAGSWGGSDEAEAATEAGDDVTEGGDASEDGADGSQDVFGEIDAVVADFVADRDLNGAGLVIVERDQGVIYEQYWGEFGPDRVSLIASSSKMITAGVLMRLDDQGLLDIDAPVADAVEWGIDNPDITIAHLVSNSSGLVGLVNFAFPPYLCQFIPFGELQACGEAVFTTDADDDDIAPPGTEFRYGGAQWQVAGAVAEAVAGKPWNQLIDEIYVEPCGVDSLGFNNHWSRGAGFSYPDSLELSELPSTDNPNIEGGAFITAPDYAQLVLMHLRGGACPNGEVLSPEAINTLHTDRLGPDGADDPDTGYAMGWWIDRETGLLTDPGAYGSVAWLDLDAGIGGYLVIEDTGSTAQELARLLQPIIADALAVTR